MIEKWKYRIFTDHVVYNPEQGVTIQKAIGNAIDIAKFEKKNVHLEMNDVSIVVQKDATYEQVMGLYMKGLDEKNKETPEEHQAVLEAQTRIKLPKQEWYIEVLENGKWVKKTAKSEDEAWKLFYNFLKQYKNEILDSKKNYQK